MEIETIPLLLYPALTNLTYWILLKTKKDVQLMTTANLNIFLYLHAIPVRNNYFLSRAWIISEWDTLSAEYLNALKNLTKEGLWNVVVILQRDLSVQNVYCVQVSVTWASQRTNVLLRSNNVRSGTTPEQEQSNSFKINNPNLSIFTAYADRVFYIENYLCFVYICMNLFIL